MIRLFGFRAFFGVRSELDDSVALVNIDRELDTTGA